MSRKTTHSLLLDANGGDSPIHRVPERRRVVIVGLIARDVSTIASNHRFARNSGSAAIACGRTTTREHAGIDAI
jgi:hypothetical protein